MLSSYFCRALVFSLAALFTLVTLPAAHSAIEAGTKFELLQVGKISYRHVQVKSVNARTVMISHDGGLTSVRLRDLSPELQARFGYNPDAEAAADAALSSAQVGQKSASDLARQKTDSENLHGPASSLQFEQLVRRFGQPPEIKSAVDLRPKFFELALNVKNQGPRPSCAVFAIVSALEFQNAQASGTPEQFSEEYLIWATGKILNRSGPTRSASDADATEALDNADAGFALSDVVTALRAYGIPLLSSLPYVYSRNAATSAPPSEVIQTAQAHNRVSILPLPGHDKPAMLANLIQALNNGVPVPIGLQWPSWRALRTGFLNTQIPQPLGGHAVTVVGYENKTGELKDTVFIFKNSWGVRWGTGGYGFVTYHYLAQYLVDAVLLEVAPTGAKK